MKKDNHSHKYYIVIGNPSFEKSLGILFIVKKENKMGFTTYKKPTRILKIWMNNIKNAKKKTISEKYANHNHISIKKTMKEFPIIKQVINSNPKISEELKLDEDELAYLGR